MQLNLRTDYALRMLMALAAKDEVVSIDWLADHYGISRNHLAKVAQELVAAGYVASLRGRGGGLRLARPPAEINVGEVVRRLENLTGFVACMGGKENCAIDGVCGLKPALAGAIDAFLTHLDQFDLAQITASKSRLLRQLNPEEA
ncbi:MAG: Rrf2 family transcriptional regulator [Rhodobacterales bacterium CG15_BIG_FIL_POST_REV_8_21_14_020_59_13]|nr:Rrf2 family transcriptional regulator [Sphingomonadales bacterium]PIW29636.1 MAG: Rrf2 family transcriptional regulator [Rhodobacterales bacterium CG15_BIG_FIL_POST_REV_8_21_14_020_59_13]PKP95816.1 MAG: Rrf2 family transcriptional regulator [Alphaproteobacteria bacterium HGW-Alphaproteobacteria-14]NCP26562.1 Rrf2 family transcriptional regulator [Sphingomonadales bacterium]NCP48602.1 Rrf2 family transcriptional regulator [Sphingomonadales bacterium]